MRELTQDECLVITGLGLDSYLGDVFKMIQEHESKLILVGTGVSFITGFYGAKAGLAHYGLTGLFSGALGGLLSGIYLVPVVSLITYKMVEQSYTFFGIVK